MSRPLRALAATLIGVGTAVSLTGCVSTTLPGSAAGADKLPPSITEDKQLKVALSPDFPPMEYRDDKTNALSGVDVELARALGKKLGLKVIFEEQRFDQLMNSVATSRVDMVMSGISDTVERQQTVDFVDYFKTVGRLYTLPKRAADFRGRQDVCGKKLAVSKTTDYYGQALEFNKKYCTGAGRPAIRILPTDSGAAARLQLEQNRADVAIQGGENLAFFDRTEPGRFRAVLQPLPAKPFAVVVKKDDKAMAALVTKGFDKLWADGTYQRILKESRMSYGATRPTFNGVKN
ncbi:transporter substrate-binding domain-containing protein [Streptomyces iranensis]|uniref:transporter substrate-binding domain-containing protein n=1 Tax=Streptomyces iranensis TaxID=576784 RepID=UPI0039B77A76